MHDQTNHLWSATSHPSKPFAEVKMYSPGNGRNKLKVLLCGSPQDFSCKTSLSHVAGFTGCFSRVMCVDCCLEFNSDCTFLAVS